jgi:hypothetical protein
MFKSSELKKLEKSFTPAFRGHVSYSQEKSVDTT